MNGKRRWFGWIAIGLGAVALLVALLGRGFGPQIGAAGRPGANAQQQYAGPQNGPGANVQPSAGPQNGPSANAQPSAGRQNTGPQGGPAGLGGAARRGGGRPGDSGFGIGGLLRLPFRLIGGSFQWVMLALLIGLGVWMIRGRSSGAASTSGRAESAQASGQEPLSPTGESYTDEPSDQE